MATRIIMPKLGLTMETGVLTVWLKSEGDPVSEGEGVCEIQTDKINAVVESPVAGVLLKVVGAIDQEIPVLDLLAIVGEPGEDISHLLNQGIDVTATAQSDAGSPSPVEIVETSRRTELKASPRARGLMDQHGLTVADFPGFKGERISESDVQNLLAERANNATTALTSLQATAARRLTESFRDVPQFSLRVHFNAAHLLAVKADFATKDNEKVTWNDFFIRAIAAALKLDPRVQRQFSHNGFFHPKSINVGFAVDTEQGLVVPVIKSADQSTVLEISAQAQALTAKARTNALSLEEVTDGTITLSNLGMFGVDSFVPIVNPPQSLIVGVGGIQNTVEWIDGSAQSRPRIEFTLACDHRAVDGAMAARFAKTLKHILEEGPEGGW